MYPIEPHNAKSYPLSCAFSFKKRTGALVTKEKRKVKDKKNKQKYAQA
jgi:hypothetical protein